jgi:cellulose biosynthesis protein BcsQ
MHFIGILNTKGGTGKTTLASCMAVRATREARVAIVNPDLQGSLTDWHGRRGALNNLELMRGVDRASDAVEARKRNAPTTSCSSTGPDPFSSSRKRCAPSPWVVIPIRASGLDLAASQD